MARGGVRGAAAGPIRGRRMQLGGGGGAGAQPGAGAGAAAGPGPGPGAPYGYRPPQALRPPFDLALAEAAFPRCRPAPDDTAFTQALLKRHSELCPSTAEQAAVLNLVTKVETVVGNLAVVPGDFAAFQLLMARQVGAFKQGTAVKGDNTAEMVFILKTLPTKEAVEGLASKVTEELKNLLKDDPVLKPEQIKTSIDERGFSIGNDEATVRVLVATVNHNLRKLKPDVHLSYDILRSHIAAMAHASWFEEYAHHSSIKVLVRLLKDMCARHPGLSPIKPWLLDTLAHHAIMNNPSRQALPLNVAFRRVLQLLASGLYLPGSTGAPQFVRGLPVPAHSSLTPEQLDRATMTAQTLLRVLARGGYAIILGLQEFEEGSGKDISNEITIWNGVVVSPLAPAYEPADKNSFEGDDFLYASMDDGEPETTPAEIAT